MLWKQKIIYQNEQFYNDTQLDVIDYNIDVLKNKKINIIKLKITIARSINFTYAHIYHFQCRNYCEIVIKMEGIINKTFLILLYDNPEF